MKISITKGLGEIMSKVLIHRLILRNFYKIVATIYKHSSYI
ncbi:hypothetical protein BAZSYMB_SCAFFOLD00027_16 [Bathymodiolus azoricus thioautotrophic gill symbiont]|uniref:Uncharacterized protein n=1 Tax=Bathymodiolus azoricus thioautotrophic gill symbiont TaxID=235205 RepID=A0A1H6L3R6_9GAMM|nr:hypothetical protein BAZSYMB_SCAFFOLD00027_16 [Bathymodiolus azoricus thioautotrophic gill symbiont]